MNFCVCDVLYKQVWAKTLPVVCMLWMCTFVQIFSVCPRLNCSETLERKQVISSTCTVIVKMIGCWTSAISASLCLLKWIMGSDSSIRKKLQHSWTSWQARSHHDWGSSSWRTSALLWNWWWGSSSDLRISYFKMCSSSFPFPFVPLQRRRKWVLSVANYTILCVSKCCTYTKLKYFFNHFSPFWNV
jgi:hypothetical protein